MSVIQQRLIDQFREHRLIFWFDEGGQMTQEFEALELPGVTALRIENNEFGLRHRMTREEPEAKFLVYAPYARPQDEANWLLDLVLAHHQFQTDKVALHLRELDLPLEFREVMERHLDFFQSKGRREKLMTRLKESVPASPEALVPMMVSAVVRCRSHCHWDQILLHLFAEQARGESDYIDALRKFALDAYLWAQMEARYGYQSKQPSLRDFLTVLFRSAMGWEDPLKPLKQEAHVFLKRWQDSQQFCEAYEALADELEEELDVKHELASRKVELLLERDVFRAVERRLIHIWVGQLVDQAIDPHALRMKIRQRNYSFWYTKLLDPYQSLEYACLYLELRRKLTVEVNGLSDGLKKYSEVYYQLDQYYRKFCVHFQKLQANERSQQLSDWIERHYVNEFVFPLNNAWQAHLDKADAWEVPGYPAQRHFFRHFVQPFLDRENKVFVIISDAFRYEIAAELMERINRQDRYQAELTPAVGSSLPTPSWAWQPFCPTKN